MGHHHHPTIVLPLSLTIIFGSFTLGFYVAIQGPTLMDLIDLLHVNNDIMSHSLAVASLAYSVGGLLSGLLFNYVDRQILIPGYYIVFGMANILTPYITNYYVFSVVTVFKMMCAGGTDCGANVWILDMWPGKDAWLQALHFSFAVGCALGPLVVEPFLSANEHSRESQGAELNFNQGSALINNENGESRIYIPYGVSGSFSLLAAFMIIFLYFLEARRKRAEAALAAARGDSPSLALCCPQQQQQQLTGSGQHLHLMMKQSAPNSPEQILMSAVQHPAAIEAGLAGSGQPQQQQQHQHHHRAGSPQHQHLHAGLAVPDTIPEEAVPLTSNGGSETDAAKTGGGSPANGSPHLVRRRASPGTPTPTPDTPTPTPTQDQQVGQQAAPETTTTTTQDATDATASQHNQHNQDVEQSGVQVASTPQAQPQPQLTKRTSSINSQLNHHSASSTATAIQIMSSQSKPSLQLADFDQVKFTSKAREADGRPPYYVMLAIALSALCLSFYCGIEITSMNYLATFAVNIDLQLPKSSAALMSSALTISFAVGRLFGIWIAAYMRPHKLFYLCSAVMALGNVFILLFANTAESLLWASVCLFGIGCGPMYASIVSFYDDKISKVTNTVSGIFILGSMFNVALNTLIIGHYIIDNALILIVCNLIGAVLLLCLFGSLHALTRIKKNQRKRKFKLQQLKLAGVTTLGGAGGPGASEKSPALSVAGAAATTTTPPPPTPPTTGGGGGPETGSGSPDQTGEQQVALLSDNSSSTAAEEEGELATAAVAAKGLIGQQPVESPEAPGQAREEITREQHNQERDAPTAVGAASAAFQPQPQQQQQQQRTSNQETAAQA